MPLQRRHALVPAVIALVAVAAFAVAWFAVRSEWARGIVARQVSVALGLPATVASLDIGFFPSPTLEIGGLEVAQPPGFGEAPFLEAGRVGLRLPWRSIFGAARVEAVSVSDAKARLVTSKDGRANWSALFPEPPAGTEAPEPSAWYVGALALERGNVEVRDEGDGSHWQVAGLALDATDVARATEFPLEVKLAALIGPNTIHYAVKGRESFLRTRRRHNSAIHVRRSRLRQRILGVTAGKDSRDTRCPECGSVARLSRKLCSCCGVERIRDNGAHRRSHLRVLQLCSLLEVRA